MKRPQRSLPALLLLASIAALQSAPLQAQVGETEETAVSDDRIVIEGRRAIDGTEVRRQVRAITPHGASPDEPLARFQRPVCPGVFGLTDDSAYIVIERIYQNAATAGIPVETEPGCRANILVGFVDRLAETMETMLEDRHQLVRDMELSDRKRLRRQEGPVRAWYLVSQRTPGGEGSDEDPPIFRSTRGSRLSAGIRLDIDLAVVLVEGSAIDDLDGIAVADYVTMRTLARTYPPDDGDAAYGTVLALFDDPAAPDRLSAFDRAYLRSLYAGYESRPGRMALGQVDNRMERGE